MRRIKQAVMLFLTIPLLAGCASGEPSINTASPAVPTTINSAGQFPKAESTEESTPTEAPAPSTEPTLEIPINPLTGLPADPIKLNRRPVMVKVSNYPIEGRPHAGLSFADIVFDYYIAPGTNRFLATFYGQDSAQIGPVRSGRFIDAQLVRMYAGLLGYGGADEDTEAELVSVLGRRAISYLEAPCPAFCGIETHSVDGVFANSAEISYYANIEGINNKQPDLPGMVFSEETPSGGRYGETLLVLYNYMNRGEWRYDHPSGKYLRWIEEPNAELGDGYRMIPLEDRVTGEQLAFSNVIIIRAHYEELAPSRQIVDIWRNDKGQQAYFFRNGQVFNGTWRAKNDTDPIHFYHADGSPMPLKPGNTWIVIAGNSSTFNETSPSNWEMFFFLP
ncbi:MAG: DUF3048 domain-containing protein [Anaerolineales bacterium]|nr:DUF3048 domain-containing protein [Anaerolineales bacterium]